MGPNFNFLRQGVQWGRWPDGSSSVLKQIYWYFRLLKLPFPGRITTKLPFSALQSIGWQCVSILLIWLYFDVFLFKISCLSFLLRNRVLKLNINTLSVALCAYSDMVAKTYQYPIGHRNDWAQKRIRLSNEGIYCIRHLFIFVIFQLRYVLKKNRYN